MAFVRIVTDCIVAGEDHSFGDIVPVSDTDEATLIGLKRAVSYTAPPTPPPPLPTPQQRVEAAKAALAAAQAELDAALAAQGE